MGAGRTLLNHSDVQRAFNTLCTGGIILYPTDTIWGIGCDATNAAAVEKIYELKGRTKDKSLLVLLDSANKLPSYVQEVPDVAYDLIEYAEKPLTIIYSGAKNLAANLVAADGSIGIRIVRHPFCQQLLQRFRKPIVSTSANVSGLPAPKNFGDIKEEILNGVDYTVNYGREDQDGHQPSSIMKLEPGGKFIFIRK